MAHPLQGPGQLAHALRRPTQWRLRIARRRRLHQPFEIREQGRIFVQGALPPAARAPHASGAALVPEANSCSPRLTVEYAIPVARATARMPPRPAACASVAAQIRRPRSVNAGPRAWYFVPRAEGSPIQRIRHPLICVQLFSDNA